MDSISNSTLRLDLESDIEDRMKLMLKTKTLFLRYSFSSEDEKFYLNYSIPIIYSIWEGFMQTSFQTYIREINRFELQIDEICDSILVYNTENNFKQLFNYPKKVSRKIWFYEKLRSYFQTEPYEINPVVNTESNVGYSVLCRILKEFNLEKIDKYPRPKYSLEVELDRFLLKIRNDVSHGNNSIAVNRSDLKRAIDLVEFLMGEVKNKIIDGFENEKFKK